MPSEERQEDNKWLYKEPRTSEELATERAERLKWMGEHFGRVPVEFSCDKCGLAGVCTLVYDPYNTNGDCLLEK